MSVEVCSAAEIQLGKLRHQKVRCPEGEQQSSGGPAAASTRLSVSNCRTSRQRDAPTAARMLISTDRPAPRASMRFATFAHAMRRTSPVTVSRSAAIGRSSPRSEGRTPVAALDTSAGTVLVGLGIRLLEGCGNSGEPCLRLLNGGPTAEPAHHAQP